MQEEEGASKDGSATGPGAKEPPPRAPRWISLLTPWSQRFRRYFPIIGFWVGVFAAIYFWIAVVYDGHLNSNWWNFTQSSFSALGDPDASDAQGLAWIYSDAIMYPTGVMIMVFGSAMVMAARNRIESTGSSFFIVAGVFLALVGFYHGGPPTPAGYHDFVSEMFFVWAAVSILVWGSGLLLERRWRLGLAMLLLVIVGVIFAAYAAHAYQWSVAETEAYGIIIIDAYLALMYFARNPLPRA